MNYDSLPELSTLKQIAEFLQISELTLRRALACRELIGIKVAGSWRIHKEDLKHWIDQQQDDESTDAILAFPKPKLRKKE